MRALCRRDTDIRASRCDGLLSTLLAVVAGELLGLAVAVFLAAPILNLTDESHQILLTEPIFDSSKDSP